MLALVALTAVFVFLVGGATGLWEVIPFQIATLAVGVCVWRGRQFASDVLTDMGRPVHDLQTLTELFDRLGGERFEPRAPSSPSTRRRATAIGR